MHTLEHGPGRMGPLSGAERYIWFRSVVGAVANSRHGSYSRRFVRVVAD